MRRGIGEPIFERMGTLPQSGEPTGKTARSGDMPFTTPAADVYQATAAVTIPAQPPAWSIHVLLPCATLKKPITSRISVISSVRKTPMTAMFTRRLQRSMYVLKIANESRNHARPLSTSAPFRPAPSFVVKGADVDNGLA